MKTVIDTNHHEIVDFIIETVQGDSIVSGFQLNISYEELERKFGNFLEDDLSFIYDLLIEREEVADVIMSEDEYDVVLYTDYAPNYQEQW